SEFVQDFSQWRILKFELVDTLIHFYLDGQFLRTFSFPEMNKDKFYGYSIRTVADEQLGAMFDWIKAYDGAGRMFYFEDFDDPYNFKFFDDYIACPKLPCDIAFTEYFNEYFDTSLSFSQI